MKTLETKIREAIKYSENIFWQIIKTQEDVDLRHLETDLDYIKSIESDKYQFSEIIKSIVRLIQVFIEKQGLVYYLEKLQREIIDKISDEYLFKIKYDPELPESSQIIEDIKEFLYPFSQFDYVSEDLEIKKMGIRYLENILKQTSFIINKSGKIPKKETDIYDIIKTVIHATFPKSQNSGSNFKRIGKEYKPDILIPELEVAIEYKYAKTEKRFIDCVEQILIDVKGYQNDSTYKIFYAIFYVESDIIGQIRFDQIWDEYQFPKNWKAFYCIGK